jgi:vacuolar-type H+-ATPase subunit C/Vma6
MTEEVLPVDYTYIVARLRAIEAELPDKAWYQRLARSPSGQLIGSLREHYRGFERVDAAEAFEDGLDAEKAAYLELVSSLIGDPAVIDFLRSGYDLDNALHLIKARMMGGEAYFNEFGLIETELFEKSFQDGDLSRFPPEIREYLEKLAAVADKKEPALLQSFGEGLKYSYLLDHAPDTEATEYMTIRIDLANIITLIRLQRSGLRRNRTGEEFIDGGTIDRQHLVSLLREPEDELYSFLQFTDYRHLLSSGLAKETPLWAVSTLGEAFALEYLGHSRLRFFDITPVLYHMELRSMHERALRSILTGVTNGLPEERMIERLDQILLS